MRQLIDLCSTSLLHRLPLAPTVATTVEADSRPAPPPQCSRIPASGADNGWAALAAVANRWLKRRIASRLAGRSTGIVPATAIASERPTPSRYY